MAERPEPKLNDEARIFVVQALACFDPPTIVRAELKAEFGFEISVQGVESYDPTKRAGQRVAAKWKALFEETRKTFLADTSKIGISHRAVRLRAIQRMAVKAEGMGNISLAAQLMEQAAKETGDSYTNRRQHEHAGKDGAPLIPVLNVTVGTESKPAP